MTISGTRAVRSASQPKIGSLTSRAAGQAATTSPSVREVDALLGEVERQHRQQPAEAEPHHELGDEQRQDRAASGPSQARRGRHDGRGGAGSWQACRDGRAAASVAGRAVAGDDAPLQDGAPVYSRLPRTRLRASYRLPHGRHHRRGPGQGLQARARSRSAPSTASTSTVAEGTVLGPARAQRRRQDDDRADPRDAAPARRRSRDRRRLRRRPARRSELRSRDRAVRPVRRGRREPDRPREPVDVRPALPAAEPTSRRRAPTSCSSSSTCAMPPTGS